MASARKPIASDSPVATTPRTTGSRNNQCRAIAEGMRFLYTRAKLACEPAGAAAAGAVLSGRVEGSPGVAVIVSGGNVEPEQAAAILRGQ